MASLAQLVVGKLIDRYPLKRIYLGVVVLQAPLFALAAIADGWVAFAVQLGFMILVFGAIPFTDAIIVRFVDDQMRSRVSGIRLAISFGVSSLAVWLLGPIVKAAGFDSLLLLMAGIAVVHHAAGAAGCRATIPAEPGCKPGPTAIIGSAACSAGRH